MTQQQFQNIQIFRKILFLFSAFVICGSTCTCMETKAAVLGRVQKEETYVDYSQIDKNSTRQLADLYFKKASEEQDSELKKDYLKKASGEYFLLTKVEPNNLDNIIQLARVYDMEKLNNYAKAYFFQALEINKTNPLTNYYFGNFYYTREDYKRVLKYYNIALNNGFQENFDILFKMGIMYEKLGDLLRANLYYKKAYLINPNNTDIPDKIRQIEGLRYQNSGYYNRIRKK